MPKKNITTDDLAIMVQKGFNGVGKHMETGFKTVDRRFDDVDKCLSKIERILLSGHEQRIERLEDDVKWLRGQLTLGET